MAFERGIGVFEASIWLVAVLPLVLMGGSMFALIHDQGHLVGVPVAVLREARFPGMRWVPDGAGGRFEVDVDGLRDQVVTVAQRAVAEAEQGILRADSVSAKACVWIFSVDARTGSLKTPIWSECDAQGPMGSELSLTADLDREREVSRGIMFAEGEGFVERVVVAGVVVAAQTARLLGPGLTYRFSNGAITFARQEVVL